MFHSLLMCAALWPLVGLAAAGAAPDPTPPSGDVWIDDAPGTGGIGAETVPFHWGNSADRFDAGMRSIGTGSRIHLKHVGGAENRFQTRGAYANAVKPTRGFQVKSGQSLLGGPGVVIQLVYAVPDAQPTRGFNIALGAVSAAYIGGMAANGVLIRDLTVDCNGPALKQQCLYTTARGIELAGTGNILRNVTVVNAINDRALSIGYDENFIISLSTYEAPSTGNIIDNCVVQNFYVDRNQSGATNVMCSAITLRVLPKAGHTAYRISGAIQNCVVNLNGFRNARYADEEYALNVSFCSDVSITGNIVAGATRGFNNDAGPNNCLLLAGNAFNQPANSCAVFLGSSSDSILRGNTFNLLAPGAIGVKVQGSMSGQEAVRWQIKENTFYSRADGNNGIYFYPAPRSGPGMPRYISVERNLFTGRNSYINIPVDAATGCNYLAGNRGTVRYFTRLSEPVGSPCPYTVPCHAGW